MSEGVPGSPRARLAAASFAMLLGLVAWCSLAVSPSIALLEGGPSDFAMGGNATLAHPGNGSPTAAQLSNIGPGSEGHVNIAIPKGLKLRQLTSLSTDFRFLIGTCSGGSPRFTANLTNGTSNPSVFFYIGPPPAYSECGGSDAYANSGDLATPSSLVDATELPGGSFNEPYSQVQANYGDYTVKAVHLDVDRRGVDQTINFDNTRVNSRLVTYEPQHGISVLLERTAGTIKIKKPKKKKGLKNLKKGFKNIKKVQSVRVNTLVDTRGGRVEVTAATGNFGATTPDNTMTFYQGLIQLKQGRARNARAVAKLSGNLQCPKKASQSKAAASSGPVATTSRKRRRRRGNHVWGSGDGNYQTAGKGGTGSVVGTTWLTKDTCRGTYFKVKNGIGIKVFDFGLRRSVGLGPGQSYFARIR